MSEPIIDESGKTETQSIVVAIMVTLLWGFVFAIISFWFFSDRLIWAIIVIFYVFLHPLIGRLWYAVVEVLFSGIDDVYGLTGNDKWSEWPKTGKIKFTAWWPVLGPVCVTAGVIGVIYGLIFKNLFK